MKDAFVRLRRQDGKRPPLPIVVSSLIASAGLWVLIYVHAGRLIWTW